VSASAAGIAYLASKVGTSESSNTMSSSDTLSPSGYSVGDN
jgi:hypothetical protein